jgi:hypothetical protein
MTRKYYKTSLIFATIGNVSIFEIFNELVLSDLRRDFLCVISLPPNSLHFSEKLIKYFTNLDCSLNYEILISPTKGQVAQRAYAIENTDSKYIIQLDDDLKIESKVIASLLKNIECLGPGNAIGPIIFPYYSYNSFGIIKKAIYKYIYGFSDCNLTKGGILRYGISIYPSSFNAELTLVEWLPGGCVCYYRSDALIYNYYPYSGKAYYEDVIASILRNNLGIRHFIINEHLFIDSPEAPKTLKQVNDNNRARNYVNSLLRRYYLVNISNVIDYFNLYYRFILDFCKLHLIK